MLSTVCTDGFVTVRGVIGGIEWFDILVSDLDASWVCLRAGLVCPAGFVSN